MDDYDRLSTPTKFLLLALIVISAVIVFFCIILCPFVISEICRKLNPPKQYFPQRRRRAAIFNFEPDVTIDDINQLDESSINEELKR